MMKSGELVISRPISPTSETLAGMSLSLAVEIDESTTGAKRRASQAAVDRSTDSVITGQTRSPSRTLPVAAPVLSAVTSRKVRHTAGSCAVRSAHHTT